MRLPAFSCGALLCSIIVAPGWGCAAGGSSPLAYSIDAGGDNGGPGPGPGDDAGSFGQRDGSNPGCTSHCSADLHSVLDCNNAVVIQCPPDQGCAGAKCIAACDAAVANQSNIGCEYLTFAPEGALGGECFAAYVANTWDEPITMTVDFGGAPLPVESFAYVTSGDGQNIQYTPLPGGKLDAGQVAVLFLSGLATSHVPCPTDSVTKQPLGVGVSTGIPGPWQTEVAKSFHITTSAPVSAYDISPYGGGSGGTTAATMLLPTAAWGTNYIAVDGYSSGPEAGFAWVAIVAAEDATTVTLSPTVDIVAGQGVVGTPKGVPQAYQLSKGDVLNFSQLTELIGTPIQSNKPVGVWGGISCVYVPHGVLACDGMQQQIPPVKALGHEYVGVRPRDRFPGMIESPPWRVVGAVDQTTLIWSPSTPTGAPTTLDSGQMVEFTSSDPFVVKSQDDQHPFYVAGYMMGAEVYGTPGVDGRGDPEFVNVIPPQEYLQSYTFFTDPTYSETELVVVRVADGQNGTFADVTLDCLGAVTGWTALGTGYEWARVDLVTGNFEKVGNCDNGRHQIESAGTFGVTVWGWGSGVTGGDPTDPTVPGFYTQYVSYAYPAGASVQPINPVVVPPVPR